MSDGSKLGLLLWLRYRTMFRGRGSARKVAVAVALLLLIPFSVWMGVTTHVMTSWLSGWNPELVREWVHLSLLLFYVVLVVMPVIGFAGTEFYDVTKLFHLPVTHRTVFVAQTIGHMCGTTVLFFLPPLVGLLLGLPGGPGMLAFRAALLIIFVFHTVALGQLLQLVLLNVLRSRRFRDLAVVLGAVISGVFYITFRLVAEAGDARGSIVELLERGISRFLIPVPSLWASSAIAPGAGPGHLAVFAIVLLPLTALIVLLSASLQERAFHGEVRSAPVKTSTRLDRRPGRALFPFSMLPPSVRAIARQELRLLGREPAVKATLIQQFVFFGMPMLFVIWRGQGGLLRNPEGLLLWGAGVFLFAESFLALNLLGLDGPAIAHLLTTPVSRRRILAGKAMAYLPLCLAANLAFMALLFVLVRVFGGRFTPEIVLAIVMGSIAAVPILLGIGAVFSVLAPVRLGARGRRALSHGQGGGGCASSVLRLLALMLVAVLLLPVAAFCHGSGPPFLPFLSLPYAAGVLLAGIVLAGRLLGSREEALIRELARGAE